MGVVKRSRAVAFGGCLLVAACGTGDDDAAVSTESLPWRSAPVRSVPHADIAPIVVHHGDEVLVLFLAEDGLLHTALASSAGEVTTGPPQDLQLGYPGLGAAARFGDRWVALGSGRESEDDIVYEMRVLESADGATWEEVEAEGLGGPADVNGLAVVGERLVAVGTARTAADPGTGGFLPIAWTSADGRVWERIELPRHGSSEGSTASVIAVGDRVLASGRIESHGMVWESTDGGSTWRARTDEQITSTSGVGDLAEADGVLLASAHVETPELGEHGEMGRAHLLRSTDAGATWSVADQPPVESEGYPTDLWSGGGWVFSSKDGRQARYEPAHCYADIDYCRNPPMIGGSLFASRDGLSWDRVDTRGIDDPGRSTIAATPDGAVVLLIPRAQDSVVWTWPAGTPLAFRDADPVSDPPDTTGIEVVQYDDQLEVGRRYAMPLGGHCGYEWTSADDRVWHLDGDEVYDFPDHWPTSGELVFGYVTLAAEDELEYSLPDGEVIATFSVPTEDPPGCA
jgi:hypothetical protein